MPMITGRVVAGAIVALVWMAQGWPTAATSRRNTSALSGVVVDGHTGRPLRGVAVSLNDQRVAVSHAVVTDSKGRWVFSSLPASERFVLSAIKPGFAPGALLRNGIIATGAALKLAEGEWLADIRLVMWPLGSIGGLVTDEQGEPVVDVPVRVLARTYLAGTTHWAAGAVTRTDDRGIYRISGLKGGTYLVNVPSVQSTVPANTPLGDLSGLSPASLSSQRRAPPPVASIDIDGSRFVVGLYVAPAPGAPRRAYPQAYYGGAASPELATEIVIAPGETRLGVDFMLQPTPTSRLSGRVAAEFGPVAGVRLRLFPRGAESFGNGAEQASSVSNRDGAFEFLSVPFGDYTLRASTVEGQLTASLEAPSNLPAMPGSPRMNVSARTYDDSVLVTSNSPGVDARAVELPITVGSDDVRGVEIFLYRAAIISGRVVREDGLPLTGPVSVYVDGASGDPAKSVLDTATVNSSDGSFTLRGLLRGEYFLRIATPALRIKSIAAGRDYTSQPFDMSPGADITGVLVTMTAETTTLSGAIRDADGLTPSSAAILVFPVERHQWSLYGLSPTRLLSMIAFGREGFRTTRLPAGHYYVIAVDPSLQDAWRDPLFLEAAAKAAVRVRLAWSEPLVQDLVVRKVSLR